MQFKYLAKQKAEMHKLVIQVKKQKKFERLMEEVDSDEKSQDTCQDFSSEIYNNTTLLWIYMNRCSKIGIRSLWKEKKNIVFGEQVRSLCDKVIQHRLSESNSGSNFLAGRDNMPIREDLVKCFCRMTDAMIMTNPDLYMDLALKMDITFHEERIVCKAFSDFAENLFSEGPTWALITSLLTFSGCLAVECSKNGRSILVGSISDWATTFIIVRLKTWIQENNMWDGVLQYFAPKRKCSARFIERPLKRVFKLVSLVFLLYTFYLVFSWFQTFMKLFSS